MQIRVYRGTHQIGGCITEIKTSAARIIIDMGEELPSAHRPCAEPIEIDGVTVGEPNCDGVLITHYHGDHAGMFDRVLPSVPVYMGAVAKKIYTVVQTALKNKLDKGDPSRVHEFHEFTAGKPLYFGDIKVTPYSIDHSAFDAYMLMIESDGKRVLHTGDFRMHGAKGRAMPALLEKYCKNVDVLITEGTMLSRTGEKTVTEHQLGAEATKLLRDNKYVFALCSSTNIDTIAEFYNAAIKTNKPFIVCEKDFQGEILNIVTENSTSSFYDFKRRKVFYYGKNLHDLMREKGFFFLGRTNHATRQAIRNFPDSLLIYSMWSGYLNKNHPAFDEYKSDFVIGAANAGCQITQLHTSGHATTDEIARLCEITEAKTVIPIHSENPEALILSGIKNAVKLLQDNEIFDVK